MSAEIKRIGNVLKNTSRPLKERFRALFTLKNLGGQEAIDEIAAGFDDSSALLKHECAYCLGQIGNDYAISILCGVLRNTNQEPIVRHEAGEALGAIGSEKLLPILETYKEDPNLAVAETCYLAYKRIKWLQEDAGKEKDLLPPSPYASVDPAPPSLETDTQKLCDTLLDESKDLFDRYRAMFSLRNKGDKDSIIALAKGLKDKSALFRHEIAFVLGQAQNTAGIEQLTENLKDAGENSMVRHECAEALGAIATQECTDILNAYLKDSERIVKESCEVALDMCEYENSEEFQYANALTSIPS